MLDDAGAASSQATAVSKTLAEGDHQHEPAVARQFHRALREFTESPFPERLELDHVAHRRKAPRCRALRLQVLPLIAKHLAVAASLAMPWD